MNVSTLDNDVTVAGGERMTVLADRYRIVRKLGQGGMGSVWLAEDMQLDGKPFAVKMLPSILVSNKRAYNQLKTEALVSMKLTHPNIVTLRAFEENNGNPFLVMDYIDGRTLDDYLADDEGGGFMTESEVVSLLRPIAGALDYAHREGVVHRDVKPANVMIRKDGRPFIMDFGIAREIQETMTRVTGKFSSGTLLYMSPEQLRGEFPRPSQDVYSFAAMVYECLKGEPPFARGQVEYQILNERPAPLPGSSLASSVMSGLAKNPADRPCSCVDVLECSADGCAYHGDGVGKGESPSRGATGRSIGCLVAAGVFVSGLAAAGLWWDRRGEKTDTEDVTVPSEVSFPAPQNDGASSFGTDGKTGGVQPAGAPTGSVVRVAGSDGAGIREKASSTVPPSSTLHADSDSRADADSGFTNSVVIAVTDRRPEAEAEKRRAEAEKRRLAEVEKRKIAEAEKRRLAEVEKRKIAEAEKRRRAEENRISAVAKTNAVSCIRDADGFDALKKKLGDVFVLAEERLSGKDWESAAGLFADFSKGCSLVLEMDRERNKADESRRIADAAKSRAVKEQAEKYAGAAWREASVCMDRSGEMFGDRKFRDARTGFAVAAAKFDAAATESVKARQAAFLATLDRTGFIPDEKNNPRPAGTRGVLPLPDGSSMEMVWCPPGCFMMGSRANNDGSETRHPVRITKGFWIGKYEVTEDEWQAVTGSGWGGRKPKTEVSYEDCERFCRMFPAKYGVRLPTEAEWEYACRSGTQTEFSLGRLSDGMKIEDDMANVNAFWGVKDVGKYPEYANAWGICDMHGNVREWCADVYRLYEKSDSLAVDPLVTGGVGARVVRGGFCRENLDRCRCASRSAGKVDKYTGFRVYSTDVP